MFFSQAAGGKWQSEGSLVDSSLTDTSKEQRLGWEIAESVKHLPGRHKYLSAMSGSHVKKKKKKKARCGMCLQYQHCRDGDRRIPGAHWLAHQVLVREPVSKEVDSS